MDKQSFYGGTNFEVYKYMGAKLCERGVMFRTFAPAAVSVAVIGEFNAWEPSYMNRVDSNFFELYIENAKAGDMYKYRIQQNDGRFIDHCDPYGFGMQAPPQNASIIRDLSEYKFQDNEWLQNRDDFKNKPLNIYELHFGSWRRKSADKYPNYAEIADELIEYVKDMGYNCIEFMPLGEHPCDESWGYQATSFFSPTARYGTAAELMELIDKCHQNGIAVLMDFIPVHFAVDDFALANFDGTPLYEYPNSDVGQSEWGSKCFMHSRGEVRSFLCSAANYWLSEYHFDGIRMDAIRNLIYWNGDEGRGVNAGGVDFLRTLNCGLKARHKGIMLCAEDSTSFDGVTRSAEEGGIGFDYKWDMGFMNDTLNYFRTDPEYRTKDYHKLTFSMMYFYNENYILPFSHDEVVHGKATIIQKMHGDYEVKFAQARALYMYMYFHPGKKLNFMGNEIGQFREWDESREQDWDLLEYPKHREFKDYIKALNHLYLNSSALWNDYERENFRWIDCHQEEKCVYVMARVSEDEELIAVFNFSDKEHETEFRTESIKKLVLVMESEETGAKQELEADANGNIKLKLVPYSGRIYKTSNA